MANVSNETQADTIHTPSNSADHDYSVSQQPSDEQLIASQKKIEEVEAKCAMLQGKAFFLERFSNDSRSIQFYTGFKDYATLKAVFYAIQPTAATMVRWAQVQRHGGCSERLKGSVFRDESQPLVDQMFMFLCRVRLTVGLLGDTL